ncbi:unnamed protein product [Allacma fusca]|uniref:Pyrroloquinoline quinone-dependent pyranose dehydrogenase beta-propeller domain-containing protein n=1 Tax=Allacma fusca TaxID=39272 RepID=A0A8J2KXK6_9HEXA|nr:unnamed protein product [Allacma fusca]
MRFSSILTLALAVTCEGAWKTDYPFYAETLAGVVGARGLYVDETGDILVVSKISSSITVIYNRPNGTVAQEILVTGSGLNHGISYSYGSLYASSSTTVYRWPYTPGQRSPITAPAETVISNIPDGYHVTRTLVFDNEGRLLVSVGSSSNVDGNSDRARIRRFSLSGSLPKMFSTGEVFADGLRNEVGLTLHPCGVVYGVENGVDNLDRADLGGDIHNENPAEEMNRFDQAPGRHYGYPYCFSTYNLTGYPPGSQLAHPDFLNDGVHSDEFCQAVEYNIPPILAMPSHAAPLGIEFFRGQNCDSDGAFPCNMIEDAVVAFHGSWNRDIKRGYRVAWIPFNETTGNPTGELIDIIYEEDLSDCSTCFQPVNAVFGLDGCLYVSCDTLGEIIRIYYIGA